MLGTMLASQQGGLPPGTQLGTKAGGGPQDKPKCVRIFACTLSFNWQMTFCHVRAWDS